MNTTLRILKCTKMQYTVQLLGSWVLFILQTLYWPSILSALTVIFARQSCPKVLPDNLIDNINF